ncbi:hypothetical protein M378DRAFT_326031, partial [Amanita muscaria Koide BX008]
MSPESLTWSSSRTRSTMSLPRLRKECQSTHPKASLSQTYSISLSGRREISTCRRGMSFLAVYPCRRLRRRPAQPTPTQFSQPSSCIGHTLRELVLQIGPWPKDGSKIRAVSALRSTPSS